MEYEVTGKPLTHINFAPTRDEEILQNVRTLFATTRYSVILDRILGIDGSVIDKPLPVAMSLMGGELVDVVRKFEPRARVRRTDYSGDGEGHLIPKARVTIDK